MNTGIWAFSICRRTLSEELVSHMAIAKPCGQVRPPLRRVSARADLMLSSPRQLVLYINLDTLNRTEIHFPMFLHHIRLKMVLMKLKD